MLTHIPNAEDEDAIKPAWTNDLEGLGYHRVVFLQSRNGMAVKGLPLLDDPQAPAKSAGN